MKNRIPTTVLFIAFAIIITWVTVTGTIPYQFPVTAESPEWAEFKTNKEMLAACQVPERKLKSMTTAALLETVMNYPLIENYSAFNSIEYYCRNMSSGFNGFDELFSRPNVGAVLLNRYRTAKVYTREELTILREESAGRYIKATFEFRTLDTLVTCNLIKNGVNTKMDWLSYYQLKKQREEEFEAVNRIY